MDEHGKKIQTLKELNAALGALIKNNYKYSEATRIFSDIQTNADKMAINQRIKYIRKCIEEYQPVPENNQGMTNI